MDELVERLRSALREIQMAYPSLLNKIEGAVGESFALPAESALARQELGERATALQTYAVEPKTKGFLVRSADQSLGRDEWLVSLGTLLGGRPPESWYDADAASFEFALSIVARQFGILESFAVDRGAAGLRAA